METKRIESLIEDVDSQIVRIRTKSLDVSFNELYDMYENEELIIAPDYQRLFRWEPEKQSRFIESLILEMPVPPIFVIETDEGIYELIDGLQRISSYLHFRGIKFGDKTEESTPLELSGCDIVPDLNGYTFETLPKTLQIKLKRSFVRMEVIKKESESSLKYHMACASRTQTTQQCNFADALFLADYQGKPCGHIVPEHCNHPSGGCTGAVCGGRFLPCQYREFLQCFL